MSRCQLHVRACMNELTIEAYLSNVRRVRIVEDNIGAFNAELIRDPFTV